MRLTEVGYAVGRTEQKPRITIRWGWGKSDRHILPEKLWKMADKKEPSNHLGGFKREEGGIIIIWADNKIYIQIVTALLLQQINKPT